MSIEILEGPTYARWGTVNTRLAACLLVYGFHLCPEQPFVKLAPANDPERASTSVWLEGDHPLGVTDSTPQDWEVAWLSWNDFRSGIGRYNPPPDWQAPLRIMRRALEARQWFQKNIIRRDTPLDQAVPGKAFQTEDLLLALCLVACGLHVFKTSGPRWTFAADGAEPLHKQYLEDGASHAIQWAKRAIIQYEILCNRILQPDNVANLTAKIGDKIVFIPVNAPPSVAERLWREVRL